MATLEDIGAFWLCLIYTPPFFVITYFAFYYLFYGRQTKRWKQSNIPFLQPTFLLGHKHFLDTTKHSVAVAIDKIYKENEEKGLFGFFIGTLPIILVKDPKLIHDIIVKNSSRTFGTGFDAPEFEVESQYMIISTSNKTTWKIGRQILSPMFSHARLAGSRFDFVNREIFKLLQHVEQAELDGRPVNISNLSHHFVMNASILPNFGITYDSDKTARALVELLEKFIEPSYRRLLGMFLRIQLPGYFQIFEPLKYVSSYMCNTMARILDEHHDRFKDQPPKEECNFIDYIQSFRDNNLLKNENIEEDQNVGGPNIRPIVGLSLIWLFTATDTKKQLIESAIHLLSLHPEHQKEIRKEVDEAMQKHGVSEFCYEVIEDLDFTVQCLYEAARLFPIQPIVMRKCSESFQVPGTKYTLRKGDRLVIAPYSMHYDAKHFQNPLQFAPDRFSSKRSGAICPDAYWSFGGGIRKCPGMKQGILLAAAFVASLVHKHEIKPYSHPKQMDATDFHSKLFFNKSKKDILVNITRCSSST